jgi:hypothetical protein
MAEDASELMSRVRELKTKSESFSLKKTKGTVTGAFIGMAGGLLIGYSRQYNLVSSAFVGAILGGMVSHLLLPKIDD